MSIFGAIKSAAKSLFGAIKNFFTGTKVKTPANLRVENKGNGFEAAIFSAAAAEIEKNIKKKAPGILKYAQNAVGYYIRNSPTVQDLLNSKLRVDMGLSSEDADRAVDDIITHIKSQVHVEYKKSNRRDSIYAVEITLLSNSLFYKNINAGTYESFGYYAQSSKYNPSGRPFEIPWLEWLMTRGTQVINEDYYVWYKPGYGRSGGGVMLNKNKLRGGAKVFRIDPEHAGTIDDNFVTRAINAARPEIEDYIRKQLG